MRSASSRPLWLLLSAAVAFGVLAWSAQRVQPQRPATTLSPGSGFFVRLQHGSVVSGVDSFVTTGHGATCTTFVWGGGTPVKTTDSPCRVVLRKLP